MIMMMMIKKHFKYFIIKFFIIFFLFFYPKWLKEQKIKTQNKTLTKNYQFVQTNHTNKLNFQE